jgi:pimeloyl-ACP methyl ester carboxylesterase
MASKGADRSTLRLIDLVQAVVEAIDACDPANQLVVVGHSADSGVAHAAVDARPLRVSRAIYIGGFPTGDGLPLFDDFPPENGELALPGWSAFGEADLAGLDERALRDFRERAVPSPGCMATDVQTLGDDRRYDVPVTVIATEFTTEMLRGWMERGLAPVQELAKVKHVEYVDMPTGHWPQFTRPDDLAGLILERLPGPPP